VRPGATLVVLTAVAVSALGTEGAGVAVARSRRPSAAVARSRRPSAAVARDAVASADPFTTPALKRYLAGRAGDITAAAYDIDTGLTFLYRPGVREQTASIIKVDILATLLHQRQGRGGLGGADSAVAQGMIEASDNDDATDLWDDEGGAPAVAGFDARAGMSQTTPNLAWGLTTTTPRDQLRLLRLIMLPGQLLDTRSRDYEYELMRHVIPSERWGISGGVAATAQVALKNGWLPLETDDWQVNSIGKVAGSGRDYLLAVMTDREPSEAYGIATIEHISAAVWRALRTQTGDELIPPAPTAPAAITYSSGNG
jgi:beta-lactamase class A